MVLSSKHLPYPADELYLVRARGESMAPKINNGDLVLVRKNQRPDNGSVIVCINDGQAMIKVYQTAPSGGAILSSMNPAPVFSPFLASRRDFRPQGVVVGVLSYSVR
jgi:repressor LexA